MKLQVFAMILGMTAAPFMSQALAAQVTNTPPWSAKNCHLGVNEWALINAVRDVTQQGVPNYIGNPVQTKALALSSEESQQEVVAFKIPRKYELSANPENMVPGLLEARQNMQIAQDSLRGKSLESLIESIQHNALIRNCRVTMKPGVYRTTLAQFNFKRQNKNLESYYSEEMPLLVAMVLADAVNFSFVKNIATWDEAVEKSLYDVSEYLGEKGSFARQNLFYGSREVIEYAKYPVRESIDEDNFRPDIYTSAGIVKQGGTVVTYRAASTVQMYPATNKTISQMVPAEARKDILFDDSVINGLELPFFGSSSFSANEGAGFYKIGASAQETALKNDINSCSANFKASHPSRFGQEYSMYLNQVCNKSGANIGMFIPMELTQVPQMKWSDMTAENMSRKIKKDESPRNSVNLPSQGMLKKLYLDMAGQDSNVDALLQGKLFVANRASLELRLKKAFSALKGRSLSQAEYQQEYRRMSSFISQTSTALTNSKYSNHDAKKLEADTRNFFLTGGTAFLLAFMDGEGQDEINVQFSYRNDSQRVGVVGLLSERAALAGALSSSLSVDEAQSQKMINDFSKAGAGCAAQYGKFKDLLGKYYGRGTYPKTKAEGRIAIKNMLSLYTQAELASSGLCSKAFHEEAQMLRQNSGKILKQLK